MKLKKLFAVVLAAAMLFCCNVMSVSAAAPADAQPAAVSPRYVNFSSVWADMYKTDWGYYNVSGGAVAYQSNVTVHVTVYVEGYFSDGEWYPIDDWEITDVSDGIAGAAGSRTLTTTGTHRAHVVAEAYIDDVLVETVEAHSTNVVVV